MKAKKIFNIILIMCFAFALTFFAIGCSSGSGSGSTDETYFYTLSQNTRNGIAEVTVTYNQNPVCYGSAAVIEAAEGTSYLITNYHVIEKNATDHFPISVTFYGNPTPHVARLVGYESYYDVAVLAVDFVPTDIYVFDFGDAKNVDAGQSIGVLGYSTGDFCVSNGIISSHNKLEDIGDKYLLLDMLTAPIMDGMSGGALINYDGELIGLASYKREAFGFAVPVSIAAAAYSSIIRQYNSQGTQNPIRQTSRVKINLEREIEVTYSYDLSFRAVLISSGLMVTDVFNTASSHLLDKTITQINGKPVAGSLMDVFCLLYLSPQTPVVVCG